MGKKLALGSIMLALILLTGCDYNFSLGTNTDLLSGLTVSNDGLSYDEVYLTLDDERTTGSEYAYGDEIFMNFAGVTNFEEKDGKVFPGAMMVVADKDGKEIIEEDDLFAQYDETGVDPGMASDMYISLTMGDPMKSGQVYTWYAKVWDKVGGGMIEGTMDVEMK